MAALRNSMKKLVRSSMKAKLKLLSDEEIATQSSRVTRKVLGMDAYKRANRISIYLSTKGELSTIKLLSRMFDDNKQVFVPTYQGDRMEMVQLKGMEDYESLPVTKWNIKQPLISDNRENALEKGGLDLILIPGVAFTADGGRCGHGRGYYDKYLRRYFEKYPERYAKNMDVEEKVKNGKTILIGLALKEQIVRKDELPLEQHDFVLDKMVYDHDDS